MREREEKGPLLTKTRQGSRDWGPRKVGDKGTMREEARSRGRSSLLTLMLRPPKTAPGRGLWGEEHLKG